MADTIYKGIATSIRPENTTSYAVGDVVGTSPASNLEFNFASEGQRFIILRALLMIKSNAVPSGMGGFRLHLFNAAPTAIADNAAFNIIAADRDKYLGYIEFDTPSDFGDTLISQKENLTFEETLVESKLYGVLETLAAFQPTSQCEKEIRVYGVRP